MLIAITIAYKYIHLSKSSLALLEEIVDEIIKIKHNLHLENLFHTENYILERGDRRHV